MSTAVALTPEEADEVRAILRRHLPPGVRVHVFGSRAAGRVKPWSDLDLVLEGDGPVPWSAMAELAEAFDESRLPWKVDLVDRATVSPQFARIVDDQKVRFL